jgi:hypothetical protein
MDALRRAGVRSDGCGASRLTEVYTGKIPVELDNTEILRRINERIHHERNRRILKRRLIDGVCYEPLAEEFELSLIQTKRIEYRYQDAIFLK